MTDAHRFTRRPAGGARRPARWLVLLTVSVAAAVSACTTRTDEPATVTMPQMNTTTSTMPGAEPPSGAAPPDEEPLPVEWIVQLGGPGEDRFEALVGLDDRIVAVGASNGELGGAPLGTSDALVAVVDTAGEVRAVTRAGTAAADAATGVGTDGTGVVACGTTEGDFAAPAGGATDLWCAPVERTVAAGSSDAEETWTVGAAAQLGGPDSEDVTAVGFAEGMQTGYVAGSISGLMPGALDPSGRGLGGGDALALQVDATGQPIWARQFGTSAADGVLDVVSTADGDGILAGFTDGALEGPSAGARDAFITRFDTTGNQRWITQVGSAGNDTFNGVTTLGEARRGTELFVAVGSTDGDIDGDGLGAPAGGTDGFAGAFGTDGALQWLSQFGSEGDESAIAIVADGDSLYVAGTTTGEFGDLIEDGGDGGATDGFLAALDASTGELRWVSRFGSEGDELLTGATVTEDGLLVLSGTTTGQLTEDLPGGGTDAFLIAFSLFAAGGGAASSV